MNTTSRDVNRHGANSDAGAPRSDIAEDLGIPEGHRAVAVTRRVFYKDASTDISRDVVADPTVQNYRRRALKKNARTAIGLVARDVRASDLDRRARVARDPRSCRRTLNNLVPAIPARRRETPDRVLRALLGA